MRSARTRIAPSPTGEDLHIGNAYTALINYAVARQSGGRFIVRIEDTDRTRLVEGSEQRILESLSWLGIGPDEGPETGGPFAPYRQSERLEKYRSAAGQLLDKRHAYYCFCTQQRLEEMRKNQERAHEPPMYDGLCKTIPDKEARERVKNGEKYVVRLNVPDEGSTVFRDIVRGAISFENRLIDDQVLLKSDGYPTYHLGVVVDDHLMEITHIIRGEEWISSTPKHILLYDFFGWTKPEFAHMPLLRNPDRSKLSKRRNPVWVSWYKSEGFLPEAVKNYLATLAWAHPNGKDIFTTDEMVAAFSLDRVQTTAPIFDIGKLRWMNGEYLRIRPKETVTDQIFNFFDKKYPSDMIRKVLPLVIERMKTLKEFESLAGFFFNAPDKLERQPGPTTLGKLKSALDKSDWRHDRMESSVRAVAAELKLTAKEVFMDLRIAVTGKSVGPPLLQSLELLGKEETLKRLSA
ncbi:glutamate--tRNA ligase [Candidatus Gottesmanbacteria bacterium RBG_16_52_11]|uniref:Glutamate--tRNA ligase n=1 Tax=Candidatus Gottesmanbacteria bacterium RBG_16_52_11 TaxID=1798374 RepID=A0A1F5YYR1_9BACT|nr:MAG: glutamate--tRNA ligase [Candidatus Gottesmanbacteria bacterium RBG_16_52_11]